MKKLLTGVGIQFAGSAVAILLADVLLAGFSVNIGGFVTAVVIFTLAQSVLERLMPSSWPSMYGFGGLGHADFHVVGVGNGHHPLWRYPN